MTAERPAEPRRAALSGGRGRGGPADALDALRAEVARRRSRYAAEFAGGGWRYERRSRVATPAPRAAVAVARRRPALRAGRTAGDGATSGGAARAGDERDDYYPPARARGTATATATTCRRAGRSGAAGGAAPPKSQPRSTSRASASANPGAAVRPSPPWTTSWQKTSSSLLYCQVPEGHHQGRRTAIRSVHRSKSFSGCVVSMKKDEAQRRVARVHDGLLSARRPVPPQARRAAGRGMRARVVVSVSPP